MNDAGLIHCPQCGHEFELSDALAGRLRADIEEEYKKRAATRDAEAQKKLREAEARERAAAEKLATLEDTVQARLKQELAEAEKKALARTREEFTVQMRDLQETLRGKEQDLKTFREQELELRRQKRDLEKAREEADIKLQRQLDEERGKIRQEAASAAAEQQRLKDLEKDKLINDLRASLEVMKRKAEQGSTETQGEVLELDFESRLKTTFVHDRFSAVPKGIRGADLVQTVCTTDGRECGSILWEMKNTKAWSQAWIGKFKQDMIETRAVMGILVSVMLPEGVQRFAQREGVWLCDPASAAPLAHALREHLIAIEAARRSSESKDGKMEMLYGYLSGMEFKQKIEGIVHAFTSMQDQLNRERRAMEKHWNEREKQIQLVIKNTVGLYGDMQGIIGGDIPRIPALELETETPALPGSEG
jgi:hypothetical protein